MESKTTTGGHLASLRIDIFGKQVEIGNQVSFRRKSKVIGENAIVSSSLSPSYNVYILARRTLLGEKLTALLTRGKPRDFFDLYFILRNDKLRLELNLSKALVEKIAVSLEKQDKVDLEREVKRFLPKSFWEVAKNLPSALSKEL